MYQETSSVFVPTTTGWPITESFLAGPCSTWYTVDYDLGTN